MALAEIISGSNTISNLLLATPKATIGYQPKNAPVKNGQPGTQPPSILFNYEGEQTVTIQSDITDHYVEDNTSVQDQIALKPERITTSGFIGELNDIPQTKTLQILKTQADKLTIINAYTPVLSTTALDAYNAAVFAYQSAQKAIDAASASLSTINGLLGSGGDSSPGESVIDSSGLNSAQNQNQQQIYFQLFYNYWRNRTLFLVQTPWAIFDNMAIESMRVIQDQNTRMVSDFEVTFKMIRFVSEIVVVSALLDSRNMQQRAATQSQGIQNFGPQNPPNSSTPFTDLIPA